MVPHLIFRLSRLTAKNGFVNTVVCLVTIANIVEFECHHIVRGRLRHSLAESYDFPDQVRPCSSENGGVEGIVDRSIRGPLTFRFRAARQDSTPFRPRPV